MTRQYGAEIEKPFFDSENGNTYAVGAEYFDTLREYKRVRRGFKADLVYTDEHVSGVKTPIGLDGLDGSFNLGEASTGPVSDDHGGLNQLAANVIGELDDSIVTLRKYGAGILNMSNHPLTTITSENHRRFAIPDPVSYADTVRGWNHVATINARAQNSPSTSVETHEAAQALNIIFGLSAVFVALYANSPFEEGRPSHLQESRLQIWDQYLRGSRVASDRNLLLPPTRPFKNVRDYFCWMYGEGTAMLAVRIPKDEGTGNTPVTISGNPSILEFLAHEQNPGIVYPSGENVSITPKLGHMAVHQFMKFSDARLRFTVRDFDESPHDFLHAMHGKADEIESYMQDACTSLYIEGRSPGANFADAGIMDKDPTVARSVVISPAALQAGLIQNRQAASRLIDQVGWDTLMGLRSQAAQHGLDAEYDGALLRTISAEALSIAGEGLASDEYWMLAYPEWVMKNGKNGAVRAREMFERSRDMNDFERIRSVVLQRQAVPQDLRP